MVETEVVCTECNVRGSEDDSYCPSCGTEDPWEERPKYDVERLDLPLVFSRQYGSDNWEMWRSFCQAAFDAYDLRGSDVAGSGLLPRMKYDQTLVFYKLTEDYELKGPFCERQEARDA